ncbi:hypothetical protein NW752_001679 [Fusarium irregulare]|uniref:Uncharacterized protein n=1 Tax=Fusarium irregulare TaxID=2494466 RepID=A0A9W8PTH3_9HYPO|nr:hypothetical protein NW766_003842 [Fusarium irregulare]KAJ4026725.1 hypothetical protein NW752_001679 [Fusarium irregulare]
MDNAQPEASALFYDSDAPHHVRNPHKNSLQNMPLAERWRQWVRRQDTETDDDNTSTEERSETRESTREEETTTTEDEATTTEERSSTTDQPSSTTEESTTEVSSTDESTSASTASSTETTSDPTTTRSSFASIEQGASCYSTHTSTSVVCHITTAGRTESHSCITNTMTSSTCAPGLFCEIHPDSGATVCMEQHNEIGTEGIVVASIFAAAIAGCMAVLVGMCIRDKRAQKKFENLKRVKTLRTAKREEQANLMAGGHI